MDGLRSVVPLGSGGSKGEDEDTPSDGDPQVMVDLFESLEGSSGWLVIS